MPGWDCHGLPIEWKIEEDNYRSKGKQKPDLSDPAAMIAFRQECRAYAAHWLSVQRDEFNRLGVTGDWANPYSTMAFPAEAQIAREIMKFAANGLLYRGSKPVMWSVVEKTALAEAEVEYEDHVSDTVWVAFPVQEISRRKEDATRAAMERSGENTLDIEGVDELFSEINAASVVIWTTTPWTLPANRAISFSSKIEYGLYRVTQAPADNWAKTGGLYILADRLASDVFKTARVENFERVRAVDPRDILACSHPLAHRVPGYDFDVPLLDGDHVTDDTGTGFVHTAPSHGREDFDIWMANQRAAHRARHRDAHPLHGRRRRLLHAGSAGLRGQARHRRQGQEGRRQRGGHRGTAVERGNIIARGRLKHQYPHSWRSKKPVIFRNTPQWFIAMDKPLPDTNHASLRELALNGHQRNPLGAGRGREPHHRHDREPARLGGVAPARLGRADRGVREEGHARDPASTSA